MVAVDNIIRRIWVMRRSIFLLTCTFSFSLLIFILQKKCHINDNPRQLGTISRIQNPIANYNRSAEQILQTSYVIKISNRTFNCAKCKTRVPCEYPNEVDLRIIMLTYNRVLSLKKSLAALQAADYLGKRVALEIWIDRSKKGVVDKAVLDLAENFQFSHGSSCVHVQNEHAGVEFQWIYSWKPKLGTKEVGMFIEDDVDVSPYFYRYLIRAREFYKNNREINGYCLNDQNCQISRGRKQGRPMPRPTEKSNMVFLYGLFCTWGYAADPEHWRRFQDWYHNNVSKDSTFDPTTPEAAMQANWYRNFKKQNRDHELIMELYLIKYSVLNKLYTLHPNLQVLEPRPSSGLTSNRKEKGLHFSGRPDLKNHGLKVWREEFVNFPRNPVKMDWDGQILK